MQVEQCFMHLLEQLLKVLTKATCEYKCRIGSRNYLLVMTHCTVCIAKKQLSQPWSDKKNFNWMALYMSS